MAKSIREAMQAAISKQPPCEALTAPSTATARPPTQSDSVAVEKLLTAANPKGRGGQNLIRVTYGPSSGARRKKKKHHESPAINLSPAGAVTVRGEDQRSVVQVATPIAKPPPHPKAPRRKLQISPHASLALSTGNACDIRLLTKFEALGRAVQVESSRRTDQREVVLGLDFGTSCTKGVFGDPSLGRSFAVPFRERPGLDAFLLPAVLFQTGDAFSLDAGTHAHRDLKLALLAHPEDLRLQVRAVAYLALAIRRARGWLLTTQAAVYKTTEIYWRFTLGLPAAQHLRAPFTDLFRVLAEAAWSVSTSSEEVTAIFVAAKLAGVSAPTPEHDLEVTVVPEIAAQIYGFVVSSRFDRQAPNLYLMADVGAGTVDSSLFRVKRAGRGKWDFEFYTSLVEPNGASNLHRHRSKWWAEELIACEASEPLRAKLEEARFQTDIGLRVPASYADYFTGIQIEPFERNRTPDVEFFDRVVAQVQGKTFWRAWKNQLLPQSSLTGIPFFLCGGGGRMEFYQKLEVELRNMPGCSWLKAEPWRLAVPSDLEALGLDEEDYDRLSVAYGLSRLEVGRVVQAMPMSRLETTQFPSWRENYVDKDQC